MVMLALIGMASMQQLNSRSSAISLTSQTNKAYDYICSSSNKKVAKEAIKKILASQSNQKSLGKMLSKQGFNDFISKLPPLGF